MNNTLLVHVDPGARGVPHFAYRGSDDVRKTELAACLFSRVALTRVELA